MKTKNLFLATALMASFAACTNEDIVLEQQNVVAGRPTVDNVELNFGLGVDSRVSYDGGYQWNSTDVIGALLMDKVNGLPTEAGWGTKAWFDKYTLDDNIHTSYPFTYADGKWSCNTKMLEGNYFFAWPWESYDGNRQVLHSLIDQKQTGIEKDVRPVSYAQNQFFIGYQRIMAGTAAQDVLNEVKMYPVLGGIQLQIVNTGTQTYHINKVVLSSNQLYSTLTIDPTNAGGYNYSELKSTTYKDFNFANYLGLEDEKGYDKTATEDYNAADALLAVVERVNNTNADGFVQLLIDGEEDARALESEAGNTAYVMILANAVEKVTDLTLSIYTDEGIVSNIDLTKINKEINAAKGTSAITSAKVKAIGPDVVNTIKVQIDDNSFYTPTEIEVYNENDLLQFIQWNVAEVGAREITATINKDVTFTEEMYDLLKENKNITLGLVSNAATLTLAAELPANILDDEQIVFAGSFVDKNAADKDEDDYEPEFVYSGKFAEIEILGEVELSGDASENITKIVVAKEASLTIDSKKVKNVNIENNGTLEIGDETKHLKSTSAIVNNNEMSISAEAIVAAAVTNNAELTIEGKATKVTNGEEGEITLEEEAELNLIANSGLVVTADDAVVTGDNTNGKIKYIEGAKIGNIGGVIYREVSGDEEAEPTTGTGITNVNTWYVVGSITLDANATLPKNVEVMGDYDIEVEVPATGTAPVLTIDGSLIINGSTTTEGNIVAGSVVVMKNAVWTNDGIVTIKDNGTITNERGEIENNGSISMPNGTVANAEANEEGAFTKFTTGEWDGNAASIRGAVDTSLKTAYENAVTLWWTNVTTKNGLIPTYYNYNPKDAEKFADILLYWMYTGSNSSNKAVAEALFKKLGYLNENGVATTAWSNLNTENKKKTLIADIEGDTEYTAAVDAKVLTMTDLTSLKAEFITKNGANQNHLYKNNNLVTRDNANVYESEDDAMIALYKKFAQPSTVNTANLNKYVNIWQFTADIKSAFANSVFVESSKTYEAKYAYVWEGCDLDNVVKVMAQGTVAYWNGLGYTTATTEDQFYTFDNVISFLKNAKMIGKTEGAAGAAKTAADTYLEAAEEWGYSNDQVKILAKAHKVTVTIP